MGTDVCIGPGEDVLHDVRKERDAQDAQWGSNRDHPDGTGIGHYQEMATYYRAICQRHADQGTVTWTDIFLEEVYEVLAESDPAKIRAELIQAIAVGAAWVEGIDRRPIAPSGDKTGITDVATIQAAISGGQE
jgi:hypothetical protein